MKNTTTTTKPAGGTRPALPFPHNTSLRLSKLVRLAVEIERELGKSPRCTINERWARLATVAGHCRTMADARAAIVAELDDRQ